MTPHHVTVIVNPHRRLHTVFIQIIQHKLYNLCVVSYCSRGTSLQNVVWVRVLEGHLWGEYLSIRVFFCQLGLLKRPHIKRYKCLKMFYKVCFITNGSERVCFLEQNGNRKGLLSWNIGPTKVGLSDHRHPFLNANAPSLFHIEVNSTHTNSEKWITI